MHMHMHMQLQLHANTHTHTHMLAQPPQTTPVLPQTSRTPARTAQRASRQGGKGRRRRLPCCWAHAHLSLVYFLPLRDELTD